ncbi:MAG TPA: PaaI family thioesterase [Firmicutes bacterium]|nr:PaaI family thioesterase [Bacillota bacterium]
MNNETPNQPETMTEAEKEQHFQEVIEYVINYTKSDYGSGIMKLMQPELIRCSLKEKEVVIHHHVEDWELNPQGSMHGGLLCAAFDNAYGMISHYFSDNSFITTVDLSTRFLKPIPAGSNLSIRVQARSTGRTLISLTGEAYLDSGLLVATSSATFMILRGKPTQINKLHIQN